MVSKPHATVWTWARAISDNASECVGALNNPAVGHVMWLHPFSTFIYNQPCLFKMTLNKI
jgi:hypothetical protein